MGRTTVQFVDRIAATPTVRLDVCGGIWSLGRDSDLSPPQLERAYAGSLLADGRPLTAAAYGNRLLKLELMLLDDATEDQAAINLQALGRELDRPGNILRWQPGTSTPVFFRTLRAEFGRIIWDAVQKRATVLIPAEPFAYGLFESLGSYTVAGDPATFSGALNANPYFETNAANWTPTGCTFVRSTAQFHQGAASGLLTPDGVTDPPLVLSDTVTVVTGQQVKVSAWVRCAVARSVDLAVSFSTAAGAAVSAPGVSASLAATTWTLMELTTSVPATAARAALRVRLVGGGVPPVGHTLHIDEATLSTIGANGANGSYFDITGIKGDVDAPLVIGRPTANIGNQSLFATRRGGTPSAAPFLLQAEAMTLGADTTVTAGTASGGSFTRTTFTTTASSTARLTTTLFPAAPTVDVRGTYRLFARIRRNGITTTLLQMQAAWGTRTLPAVRVPTLVWQLVDLGLISMPSGADPIQDGPSGVELPAGGDALTISMSRSDGTDTVDVDYLLAVPADDRLAIVTWGTAAGSTRVVLDGEHDLAYRTTSTGEVLSGPSGYFVGGLPMVSPGVVNRIVTINEVQPGSDDGVMTIAPAALDVAYWPRYLYVAPVAS
jgi:hypothetical protein